MPYTHVTRAKNGEDAIKYIRGNGKGHNGAEYRNEYFTGINMLPDSVISFEKQMQIFWDKADPRHKVQVDRYFISYSLKELDPDNPEDVLKAHNIGCEIAREIAPGHQAVVATQTDGKGHKIHTHIDVNDINMETLKGLISTQYMHYKVREISDRICQQYFNLASPGMAPERESTAIRGTKIRDNRLQQKTYIWRDDLKVRIKDAATGAVDETDFFSRLRANGVEVEKRKATKKQPEYYLYELVDTTYFSGPIPQNLKSKSYKLGGNYQPENILKLFQAQQEQTHDPVSIPTPKPTYKPNPKQEEKPETEMDKAEKDAKSLCMVLFDTHTGWKYEPGKGIIRHMDEASEAWNDFKGWRVKRKNELKKRGKKLASIYNKDKSGTVTVLQDNLQAQFRDFLDQRDHPEKYATAQKQPQAEPMQLPTETPKEQPEQQQTQEYQPMQQEQSQVAPAQQSQADQAPQKVVAQQSALVAKIMQDAKQNQKRQTKEQEDGISF